MHMHKPASQALMNKKSRGVGLPHHVEGFSSRHEVIQDGLTRMLRKGLTVAAMQYDTIFFLILFFFTRQANTTVDASGKQVFKDGVVANMERFKEPSEGYSR
jgi:hypothetical protein